jgi:phosphoglycolate phosphatase
MINISDYTTYLFDFDYTLADSSKGIVECFHIVLDRNNWPDVSDDAIKRTIGMTLEDSFAQLTGVNDPDILSSLTRRTPLRPNSLAFMPKNKRP